MKYNVWGGSWIMWAKWLFTTISSFQTLIIALLSGCSPVSPHWSNLKTFRSVHSDLCATALYITTHNSWWRHQMEAFSALLAICAGNSPVPGEFPLQRPVTRSFDVFFDLRLSKPLSKQSRGWWFETPSRPLWRHCNVLGKCGCHRGGETHDFSLYGNGSLQMCEEEYESTILDWNAYSEEIYKRQFPSGKASSTTYKLWSQIFQKLWYQDMELTANII